MEAKKQEEYYADLYLRLSREDGDKAESDSIANQRELLMDYLSSHPEIQLHEVRTDDGYSGVNYDRPGFIQMMEAVKAKEINCIIVKDFSRLGRNFIETGKYIEKIFPFMGVRFISVNDDYDSAKPRTSSDNLIVPVKNLMKNTRHLGGVNC
jgi:DNA invertase Pin-like site-specific DNA recombinase